MPPLLLDDEEAVAVAVGLRTAAVGAIAVYLGLLGFGFRVASPPELADRIRDLAARYQRSVA
jgi:predicted DNA-binding transcriptional regulator YafY